MHLMNRSASRLFPALTAFMLALCGSTASAAIDDLFVVAQDIFRVTPTGQKFTVSPGTAGAIAIDSRGTIFVSNTNSDVIQTIALNGSRVNFASNVNAIALAFGPDGRLYAGTFDNILVFAPDGSRTIFASLIRANGMAFDKTGNLYVADSSAQTIYKFTPQGARSIFATNIPNASELAFDDNGNLYVTTYTQNQVIRINPNGVKIVFTTDVYLPTGIAFGSDGLLYVSNNGAGNIARFLPTGGNGQIYASNIALPDDLVFERPHGISLNISTRMRVETGANALIGGFIVTGTENKEIIIRALGPSLSGSGVAGALQDPVLELYNSTGALVTTIDDWKESGQRSAIERTGIPPGNDREAAGVFTVAPGAYTAVVRGKNNTSGVGLVEVYDLDERARAQLANISTRGRVDIGDNVMIGGFILGQNGARVLIRALGPSLAQAGVPGVLNDPTLRLFNADGEEIAANDNWREYEAEVQATGAPPADDRESAIVTTLAPSNYTALVAGAGGTTGVALIEVYNLNK